MTTPSQTDAVALACFLEKKAAYEVSRGDYEDEADLFRQAAAAIRRALPAASSLPAGEQDLRLAAQAVVDRWETPLWKDAEPTAHVIARLRAALQGSPSERVR